MYCSLLRFTCNTTYSTNSTLGMDDGLLYSCDMCNFKTIRKDIYMLHIVKHKDETIQKNGICEPLVPLEEVSYDKTC